MPMSSVIDARMLNMWAIMEGNVDLGVGPSFLLTCGRGEGLGC